jgi:serine 3-dehydrogenase (NADP+)
MSNLTMVGKVAVVVGASSGMGKAIAETFAKAGAQLTIAARREDVIEELAFDLGDNCLACPTDARHPTEVHQMISQTLEKFGRIDILVYATGTNIPQRSLETLTHETWDMMLATNVTGAFNCVKAVLPPMQQQQEGLIIFVSSTCVKTPDVSGVSYQASKHALSGLAHGTFKEQQMHGIRTTVIYPGLCDTPLVLQRPVATPAEVLAKALQPQDVADACLYVATAPPRARIAELVLQPAGL